MDERLLDAMRAAVRQAHETMALTEPCPGCGVRITATGAPHSADCWAKCMRDYLATLDAPKGETIHVRIPVVANVNRRWASAGGSAFSDDENMAFAHERLGDNTRSDGPDNAAIEECFVEADIPLPTQPEPPTIVGEVVKG